jgi:hypothetical protein
MDARCNTAARFVAKLAQPGGVGWLVCCHSHPTPSSLMNISLLKPASTEQPPSPAQQSFLLGLTGPWVASVICEAGDALVFQITSYCSQFLWHEGDRELTPWLIHNSLAV